MDNFKKVDNNSLYYRLAGSVFGGIITAIALSLLFGIWMAIGAKSWTVFYAIFGGIFLIAFLYGAIKSYLEYMHLNYKLAEQSVNFRDGMLSVHTTTIPYSKITNATYDQGVLARIFSVGDINIDQEDSSFNYKGVSRKIADEILDAIAKKSNVQPVSSKK